MSAIVETTHAGSSVHEDAIGKVTDIWENVLSRQEIAPLDDFFDLGGNSMLLIAILEIVEEKFHKIIVPDDLSEGVTIERMARLLGSDT